MKWGISTSFLGRKNLKLEDVSIIKNSGIDIIDLDMLCLPNDKLFIDSLFNELTSRRLKVQGMHALGDVDLSSPEDRIRKQAVSEVKKSIDLLVKTKGHIIVVHPASVKFKEIKNNKERISRFLRTVESLREISEYCQKEKVKVAIENLVPDEIYNTPEELMNLINTCDSENIGICLDTGHANSSGNLAEMLKICGSHIIALHINDNHRVAREKYKVAINDEHLLPFEGDIDWDGFIKELKKINYRGVFIFELTNHNKINLKDFLKKIKETYHKLERLTKSDTERKNGR